MSLLCIGECMIELGGRDGDTWRMSFAGDTFNAAWAARALTDAPVDYHTAHGDDPFSDAMRTAMREAGIGEAASPHLPGRRPGLYAITLDGAERSFTYWRSDAAARHLADDADALRRSLADRTIVFLSGITLAIVRERARLVEALRRARADGARIAFDPNHRPALWSAAEADLAHADLLPIVDYVMTGCDDEAALGRDSDVASIMDRYDARHAAVFVKDGANGAHVRGADGAIVHVPASPVDAVDTTGAGDAFDGGALAALVDGHDPVLAARQGAAVAAATVTVHGARASADTIRQAVHGE